MSERIDAVLFDLDGTLVATMDPWDRCWQDYADRHGHIWTESDRRRTHGHGDWAHHLARVCGVASVDQVVEECTDLMITQIQAGEIHLLPGADALLATAANAVVTGVVSASPRRFVQAALAHFDLERYLRVVVAGEDPVATKPHPAPYLHAAALLGILPQYCVAVEDSRAGIRSAYEAGMQVLAIPSWSAASNPVELVLAGHHATDAIQAHRWLRDTLDATRTGVVPSGG